MTPHSIDIASVDPNLVTPGVIGFVVIFLIAVATVFLILDMTRRIRRTRYREEVRATLADEAADAAAASEAGELPEPGEDPPSRMAGS